MIVELVSLLIYYFFATKATQKKVTYGQVP